ncbi:MAG TPA: DedA family protein/thiosulfate sulfurtransferase GlpE [Burkholderiales bacterium]
MSTVEALVRLVAQHGVAIVFANVLLEQIGLPLPAIPILIIAGALAVDGHFSALTLFSAAFIACTIGDTLWYLGGRRYGNRVMRLLCRISLSPDSCVRQTEYHFERWGGLALVFAKFIPGLSTIAPPLAGATRLGWAFFMLWNSVGIVIWAGAAIGTGMLFHAQIDGLLARLEDYGAFAIEAIAALLAGYVALKWWERRRFYKMLRVARITADELHRLKQGGKDPVVVDVRSASSRQLDPRFVPGALAMDIAEVDQRLNELPNDREIIFYCTCPNEASAAQVAKKLIELGYTRVRPLQGGLDAWVAAGLEVERRASV